MSNRLFLRHAFTGAAAFFITSLCLWGQGSAGRIEGTVTDQSAASVPGATITIIDSERGVARTLATDTAGAYSAPNLTPGTYTVKVEFKVSRPLNAGTFLWRLAQKFASISQCNRGSRPKP